MVTYTDEALVERLILNAIGFGSQPELTVQQVSDLMLIAIEDGAYTSEGMRRAAVTGWAWKAGLTADRYDLGGQGGSKLSESQWHAHCRGMANQYHTGALSVDGATLGIDLVDGGYGNVITITSDWATG